MQSSPRSRASRHPPHTSTNPRTGSATRCSTASPHNIPAQNAEIPTYSLTALSLSPGVRAGNRGPRTGSTTTRIEHPRPNVNYRAPSSKPATSSSHLGGIRCHLPSAAPGGSRIDGGGLRIVGGRCSRSVDRRPTVEGGRRIDGYPGGYGLGARIDDDEDGGAARGSTAPDGRARRRVTGGVPRHPVPYIRIRCFLCVHFCGWRPRRVVASLLFMGLVLVPVGVGCADACVFVPVGRVLCSGAGWFVVGNRAYARAAAQPNVCEGGRLFEAKVFSPPGSFLVMSNPSV